ncbi:hypothetical protein ACFL5O_02770 [Myxococcota bacterium]
MFGTVRVMGFFVIEPRSRAVHIAGTRIDPDGAWMMQVTRNLLDPEKGFLRNATLLIHDGTFRVTRGASSVSAACAMAEGRGASGARTWWFEWHPKGRSWSGSEDFNVAWRTCSGEMAAQSQSANVDSCERKDTYVQDYLRMLLSGRSPAAHWVR